MTCPFLKESQVTWCEGASPRKAIPVGRKGRTAERCSTAKFAACPVYLTTLEPRASAPPCPFLRESPMQYCAAAPVTRFVPYSEATLTRCGTESHRYCELFLAMAHPDLGAKEGSLAAPKWLAYAPNHMWIDAADGVCHVGVDAFLARVLGTVERLTYVWQKGRRRPAAVLTSAGTDFEVMFPNVLTLTGCNLHLRADPSRVASEPYTGGWLFEGVPEPGTFDNLIPGAAAGAWMEDERRRMNEWVQQQAGVAADGGVFSTGLARHFERSQMLALFHEFFSPFASGKREPEQ